jgi:outer membrane biosynthesis protein TonB
MRLKVAPSLPFRMNMNTLLRSALAALLLVACGGEAADPSSPEYSNDSVESPAAAPDAPELDVLEPVAQVEPTPEPEPVVEVAPSTPAPSDEPEVEVLPEPEPAPSPATRDDEVEVEVEPTPEPEPEPVPGWIQGGDVCTDTAQCVAGLTCAAAGLLDELVCAYDRRAEAPLAPPPSSPGSAADGEACNTDELCSSGLCTPARPGDITGVCEPMPADGVTHFCRWLTTGCR